MAHNRQTILITMNHATDTNNAVYALCNDQIVLQFGLNDSLIYLSNFLSLLYKQRKIERAVYEKFTKRFTHRDSFSNDNFAIFLEHEFCPAIGIYFDFFLYDLSDL